MLPYSLKFGTIQLEIKKVILVEIERIKSILNNINNLNWSEKEHKQFTNYLKEIDLTNIDDNLRMQILLYLEQYKENKENINQTLQNNNINNGINATQEKSNKKDIEYSINYKSKYTTVLTSILVILIIIALIITGIFIKYKFFASTNENYYSKDKIKCTSESKYSSFYYNNISTKIEILFSNNIAKKEIHTTRYTFEDKSYYKQIKSYNNQSTSENKNDYLIETIEFDDKNYIMTQIQNIDLSKIPEEEKNSNYSMSYNRILEYYVNLGYICNGESKSLTDYEITNTQYPINKILNIKNNLFTYNGLELKKYDSNTLFAIVHKLTNITTEKQLMNINIKFYDKEKNIIGEYQYQHYNEEEGNSPIYINPNENLNSSFTIYSEDLKEGKTVDDIEYVSIEDISPNSNVKK